MSIRSTFVVRLIPEAASIASALWLMTTPVVCHAQLVVAGSLTYDSTTGDGFQDGDIYYEPGSGVNNNGVAVGWTRKYDNGWIDNRAVRWDGSGAGATELGNLGADSTGDTSSVAYAVNDANTAVGESAKYLSGVSLGRRAVRWDASVAAATELGHIGTDSSGVTSARAQALNDDGTSAGWASKYIAGVFRGFRAVRWDSSGTAATELGTIGTDANGATEAEALAVNDAGTAVGYSRKHLSGNEVGLRAVRWDASGTVATELDNLGTDASGDSFSKAVAVNNAGTAVGVSSKFDSGAYLGQRAVRWDASGTTATELGDLGTTASGTTFARALDVNEAGDAVGYADKRVSGINLGSRAVRWDASGTTATELGNLGTDNNGRTNASARAINEAGTAVGVADKYVDGQRLVSRAAVWLPDGSAIDLNDLGVLPTPVGGSWLLRQAIALSSDGWVAGMGTFTPAVGESYVRHWVTQVGLGGEWTDEFTGSLNGAWGRGPQWSTGTPAMQVGGAVFNANASYTVSLDRNERTRTIAVNAGEVTLDFSGFTLEAINGMTVTGSASLKGAGTINGAVSIADDATLAPGVSTGLLTVTGNYTMEAGALEIELGGAAAGQFDHLSVLGDATLAGSLDVKLFGGFSPSVGQSWEIIDVDGTLSGAFAGLTEGAAIANFSGTILSISYSGGDGNDVILTTSQGIAGDFDVDSDVDAHDFLIWQRGGSPNPFSTADYTDWKANFGELNLPIGTTVPEPNALALLAIVALIGTIRPHPALRNLRTAR